jgi:hypothetical protein
MLSQRLIAAQVFPHHFGPTISTHQNEAMSESSLGSMTLRL